MRLETKIHPQYVDDSMASKELQACVKTIDAIVELMETKQSTPQCIRKTLQWCNERSSFIMAQMDTGDTSAVWPLA